MNLWCIRPAFRASRNVCASLWLGLGLAGFLPVSAMAACDARPSGLVSWWAAENSADDNLGANNGTLQGGAGFGAGEVGQAFSFNGTSAYVQIPDAANLNYSSATPVSVELWAYRASNASAMTILGKRLGSCGSFEYEMGFDTARGLYFTGPSYGVTTGVQLPLNQWVHLAATFNGGVFQFYTNGVKAASSTGALGPANNAPLTIGSSGGCSYFAGMLDEVSIYSRALTAVEVKNIFLAGSAGKCGFAPTIATQPQSQTVIAGHDASLTVQPQGSAPLTYQWRMNGNNLVGATQSLLAFTGVQPGNAGTYSVAVSNAYGFAISSNAVLTVVQPVCAPAPANLVGWWQGEGDTRDVLGMNTGIPVGGVTYAAGRVGQAFNFDGSTGYVDVPNRANLNPTSSVTVEAWINLGGMVNPAKSPIIFKRDFTGGGYGLEVGSSSPGSFDVLFQAYINGSGWVNSSTLPLGPGWNHVAGVYDGTNLLVYANGVAGPNAPVSGALVPATNDLCIGHDPSSSIFYFSGLIDEPSVYSRALSAAEILAIYNADSTGKCGIAPGIVTQPQGATVPIGTNVTLFATVSGTSPLTYQWELNGDAISGATTSVLTMNNVTVGNSGTYTLMVSNSKGSTNSSGAVLNVATPACVTIPNDIVSWWQGEGNLVDVFTANNGTVQSNLTYAAGEVGQAFNFDGATTYFSVPASATLNVGTNSGLSLECWIRPNDISTNHTIAEWNNGSALGPYLWIGGNANSFFATLVDTAGTSHTLKAPANILGTANFQHVAVTYDKVSGTTKLYYNGTAVASTNFTSFTPRTTYNFVVGKRLATAGSSAFYNGQIDELSLYNRALSGTEILAIFNSGHYGKCGLPPIFLTQPVGQSVKPGANVTLSVRVYGSDPIAYQWQLNGNNVAGATGSSLVLSNIQPSSAGSYTLAVSNGLNSGLSAAAAVDVNVMSVLGNGVLLTNAQYIFPGSVTIVLQNAYANGAIFYTLDGSTPTANSTQYTHSLVLTTNCTIRTLGFSTNFLQSGQSDPIAIVFPKSYTLNILPSGGGKVTNSPTGTNFQEGSVVTLTAAPTAGWTFLQWQGDVSGTSPTTTVLMNRNKSVQAVFGTTLTTTVSGPGSIVLNPPGGIYPYGATVQISAVPQTGNYLVLWGGVASGKNTPFRLGISNANQTVSALFATLGNGLATLTVVPVGHGRVTVNPQTNVYTLNPVVNATLTATPDTGHSFLGWSGGARGIQNPLSVPVNGNITIYANFSTNNTSLSLQVSPLGLKDGLELNLSGEIGTVYELDASSDLSTWTPLITVTNNAGTVYYIDYSVTNFDQRFYTGKPVQ